MGRMAARALQENPNDPAAAREAFLSRICGAMKYQLFVPRELAPDLTALTGQVMRQREDKGSSLRFEAAKAYDMRHRLGGELFSQKLRATLEKGREVLTAAAQTEQERLRQAEELRKAQEVKHTLRPRGPSLGM
jgi:hypothetical protein